jgi:hypothetical protein
VVVGGGLVGGVVVGGAVAGGAVAGGVVAGGGDLVADGAVVGDEAELPLPGVFVVVGDVGLVLVLEFGLETGATPPVEAGAGAAADSGADDFPLERAANQSCSTPCPVASPFLESLTKRYSA